MSKHKKIYDYLMLGLIIIYIEVIFNLNILIPDKIFSQQENRVLQKQPKFSIGNLIHNKLTLKYEKYIADQFPFRDFWIGTKFKVEKAIGKKDNNEVYLGKDGFLLQKFKKPKDEELEKKINAINSFSKNNPNLKKHIMIVPNSTKILEDKLPDYAPCDDQLIYINKVRKSLDKDINFINVYNTLYSKKNEYIYYKTDHHWTTKGAYYAYEKLAKEANFNSDAKKVYNPKKVSNDFYGSLYSKGGVRNIEPDSIELYIPEFPSAYNVKYYDSNREEKSIYKLDNLNKKDKYTVFLDGNHPLIKITSKSNNSNKKLLLIKDSYANSMINFLIPHFSEIYIVDLRYHNEDLSELIKTNKVNEALILYNANNFFEDTSLNNISW